MLIFACVRVCVGFGGGGGRGLRRGGREVGR
jgi:hypothetical protein